MSLGQILSSFESFNRTQAESMMLDSCRITAPGSGEPVWDPDINGYVEAPPVVVYEGRCQLPKRDPNIADTEAGEAAYGKAIQLVVIPARPVAGDIGDPLAVRDGHTVTITSRPDLVFVVREVSPQTYEKSRKLSCDKVSRDVAG